MVDVGNRVYETRLERRLLAAVAVLDERSLLAVMLDVVGVGLTGSSEQDRSRRRVDCITGTETSTASVPELAVAFFSID